MAESQPQQITYNKTENNNIPTNKNIIDIQQQTKEIVLKIFWWIIGT